MSAPLRWFYYGFLRSLLRHSPRPIYRVPAILLAAIRLAVDPTPRTVCGALIRALGRPATPLARWRLLWAHCYHHEVDTLLALQAERLTTEWIRCHVRRDRTLPGAGAVIVYPHHANQRLIGLALSDTGAKVGQIGAAPPKPEDLAKLDYTVQLHYNLTRGIGERVSGPFVFPRARAGRQGKRFLEAGGYLIIAADDTIPLYPAQPILGKMLPVGPGTAWFGGQTGKPIIPAMVVPEGRRWRLWLGDAVAPTQEAVNAALEGCIGRAPGSWLRCEAMAWVNAPDASARGG